jgi:hypothetical protein
MANRLNSSEVLRQIDNLTLDLIKLKKNVLRNLKAEAKTKKSKPSLFGSVSGNDISEEIIEESKKNLFRELKDM